MKTQNTKKNIKQTQTQRQQLVRGILTASLKTLFYFLTGKTEVPTPLPIPCEAFVAWSHDEVAAVPTGSSKAAKAHRMFRATIKDSPHGRAVVYIVAKMESTKLPSA